MHELAIACNIVELADAAAKSRRVKRLTLEIGELAGVTTDMMKFCFSEAAEGTLLENAQLKIIDIPARGLCRDCGAVFHTPDLYTSCSCGSFNLERLQGEELNVKSIEVEAPARH